jgi:hypothetical protein
MEFKQIKLSINGLKWMKDNLVITETGETELKELETLLEQREKMLDMLKHIVYYLDNKSTPNIENIKQLIKESTKL